jgi:5-methyltetrahydropteroyltriglutamate--homocysteine methyltransferase
MTVEWWRYAQSLTDKPMKGMLTGPVTILNWSFVRDDVPAALGLPQIALAIRDEVVDLERAGARRSRSTRRRCARACRCAARLAGLSRLGGRQLPALGLGRGRCDPAPHPHVLFGVQRHHRRDRRDGRRCHLDRDRALEDGAARRLRRLRYPAAIGPGVYDIHAPRVPSKEEMVELMRLAQAHLAPEQLWVNPDCGLKTRKWEEVKPAIDAMVAAARELRVRVAEPA